MLISRSEITDNKIYSWIRALRWDAPNQTRDIQPPSLTTLSTGDISTTPDKSEDDKKDGKSEDDKGHGSHIHPRCMNPAGASPKCQPE